MLPYYCNDILLFGDTVKFYSIKCPTCVGQCVNTDAPPLFPLGLKFKLCSPLLFTMRRYSSPAALPLNSYTHSVFNGRRSRCKRMVASIRSKIMLLSSYRSNVHCGVTRFLLPLLTGPSLTTTHPHARTTFIIRSSRRRFAYRSFVALLLENLWHPL